MGLAPMLVDTIFETIARDQRGRARRSCWSSRTRNYALDVAARGYVLETGHVVLTDTSENLRNDERVQAAYLGA